ncbi:MAG: efflux RND transporter periplasmic adaptor subunit [Deltaproteobacteria bacterium]|nr:efflux RND transporter periplasmic adaptor subunit [Deltaproteobacteria bacterium]
MNPVRSVGGRRLAHFVLAVVCGGLPLGCDGGGSGGGKGKPGAKRGRKPGPPAQAMQVHVVHLEPHDIERWYRTSGTLEAIRSAELVAVQPAIIQKIFVDEGDVVRPNQKLASLDGRELSLQADAARLELANLQAELERLESVPGDAISREEIDKQRYLVETARSSVRLSRHQAKQTVIRAPFAGTIVTRYVDEGNLASTATPLFHLAQLDVLELPLHVPEKDAATVKVGADVHVELVDGTAFTAKLERRAPVVDPLTGTVKFTMQARETPAAAAPGAFARARVLVDSREAAPSLPRDAVFKLDGKSHVFVVAEGKSVRREVTLGLEGAERIEILAGLTDGDAVVAEGSAGITEGMPLTAVDDEAEAEIAAAHSAKDAAGS